MDVDSEEPPTLVEVQTPQPKETPDSTTAQLQDLSLTKVPLTIVTGTMVPPRAILSSVDTNCRYQVTLAPAKPP